MLDHEQVGKFKNSLFKIVNKGNYLSPSPVARDLELSLQEQIRIYRINKTK